MKKKQLTPLLAAVSTIALLAGCAADSDWGREAGAIIDYQSFGVATTNNTAIQSGEKSYVIDLAARFSREVTNTVNFAFNSAVLDEPARAIIRQQAVWIRQFPEVRFKVFGHTDLVGSNAYNHRLGMRRARAVVSYLSSLGINRSRLQAVVSHGETQPLVATENPEARNRRTVTDVSGFVETHPLILNGEYGAVIFREYITAAVPPPGVSTETELGGGE